MYAKNFLCFIVVSNSNNIECSNSENHLGSKFLRHPDEFELLFITFITHLGKCVRNNTRYLNVPSRVTHTPPQTYPEASVYTKNLGYPGMISLPCVGHNTTSEKKIPSDVHCLLQYLSYFG